MKFLLDTDHISILQRGLGPEFTAMAGHIRKYSPIDLSFSVVSFHEQTLGCHTYITRAKNSSGVARGYEMLGLVIRTFSATSVLPFDATASATFDGLMALRLRVGTMDLRIASIALSRGLILVTRNSRDFGKVPGLSSVDWTA